MLAVLQSPSTVRLTDCTHTHLHTQSYTHNHQFPLQRKAKRSISIKLRPPAAENYDAIFVLLIVNGHFMEQPEDMHKNNDPYKDIFVINVTAINCN